MGFNVLITNPVAKTVLEQNKENKKKFVDAVMMLNTLEGNTIGTPIKGKRHVWSYTNENATIYYKKQENSFTVFHVLFFNPEQKI